MATEIWHPVVGWEDYYSVSDHGRVRREQPGPSTYVGRLLATSWLVGGYPAVRLRRPPAVTKIVRVHQLVAEAFLGPCPRGKEIHHRNGNRTNGHVANLKYVTHSENQRYSYRLGLASQRGANNGNVRLTADMVRWIRKVRGLVGQRALAEFFGIHPGYIGMIQRRECWREV